MNFITKKFNLVDNEISFVQENIEFFAYMLISFFIPFVLGHPQWLIGTIVNAALILGALNLKFNKVLPVIMIPSIGVLSAGLIFGTYTHFLLYIIPFIWVGNALLVLGIKYLNLEKKNNYLLSLTLSSVIKMIFLFGSVSLLIYLGILPTPMIAAFGLLQLYTALMGGGVAYGLQYVKKKYVNN